MKFRVWSNDNECKGWEKDKVFLDTHGDLYKMSKKGGLIPLSSYTHILQVCTDVKDIKGRDIYVGDILRATKHNTGKHLFYGIVTYNKKEFILVTPNNPAIPLFNIDVDYEIVANQLDNPRFMDKYEPLEQANVEVEVKDVK